MFPDLLKGLFAQVMLDLAGVFCCGLLVDAQRDEKAGQHFVPFIYIGCNLKTGRREGDETVFIHFDIAVFAQLLHCHADTGFGVVHLCGDVDGADLFGAFFQDQYGF